MLIANIAELKIEKRAKAPVPPPPLDRRSSDEVDFEIHGAEMQYVEIELDPGESAVAEAGTMMFKDPSIGLNAVFGDGSGQEGGFMDKLLGVGKRVLTGEGVSIGIHLQRRILTGLFGGEGFIMQKLVGDGLVCMHAGGSVIERELGAGEQLHVDTGCVVAMEASVLGTLGGMLDGDGR